MPLLVFATITAAPGKENALRQAFEELIPVVHTEPACQRYELYQSLEDPTRFIMHELWDDEAGLEAHSQMPHMNAFREKAGAEGWFGGPVELKKIQA
jgi:quinol monooxygenase YgiN